MAQPTLATLTPDQTRLLIDIPRRMASGLLAPDLWDVLLDGNLSKTREVARSLIGIGLVNTKSPASYMERGGALLDLTVAGEVVAGLLMRKAVAD